MDAPGDEAGEAEGGLLYLVESTGKDLLLLPPGGDRDEDARF